MTSEQIWFGVGLLGEAQFGLRFLVQWIASERRRASVIPHAFWYFSVSGAVTLLAYAIYRRDPVFIVGETLALLIFIRNVWLIRATGPTDP